MQIIRLKTKLSEEELLKRAHEREAQFKAIPGLLQKYYVKMAEPGNFGGIYVWDTKESLQEFRKSALAASIPQAYELMGAPGIEVLDILFLLRD